MHITTTLESRLRAKVCEMCGTDKGNFEIHYLNKVKNLKGKTRWEQIIIAKNRKTMGGLQRLPHKNSLLVKDSFEKLSNNGKPYTSRGVRTVWE